MSHTFQKFKKYKPTDGRNSVNRMKQEREKERGGGGKEKRKKKREKKMKGKERKVKKRKRKRQKERKPVLSQSQIIIKLLKTNNNKFILKANR